MSKLLFKKRIFFKKVIKLYFIGTSKMRENSERKQPRDEGSIT